MNGLVMKTFLIHEDKRVAGPFLEAAQDNGFELLSDNPQGLISCGHACCYAVIVKSNDDVALAHQSSANLDIIEDMIEEVAEDEVQDVTITLARSLNGYTTQWERDKENQLTRNRPFNEPTAVDFFNKQDTTFLNKLKKKFPKITIQMIEMIHPFLVISSKGNIELYEHHELNQIDFKGEFDCYDDTSSDEVLTETREPAAQAAASSSSQGFFNTPVGSKRSFGEFVKKPQKTTADSSGHECDSEEDDRSIKQKVESPK